MQASVIMVSYHTGGVLFVAVASVLKQAGLAELIVVDNGNPPDVVARLQQLSLSDARLKVISGQGNVGFAKGCNLGAKHAIGEYLLLLNPDCVLPPGALATLIKEMSALPGTMLAGPKLVNPDGSEQRGGRRALLTPKTALIEALGLHHFGFSRLNKHQDALPETTHDVPAISGACMCVRKSDFEKLGGLDESYFLHVDDLDFCMRVSRAGGRAVCVPSVVVAHLLSTSGQTDAVFLEKNKAKGFVHYFEKYFGHNVGLVPLLKGMIWLRYGLKRYFANTQPERKQLDASKRLMILSSSLLKQEVLAGLSGKTVLVTGATSQLGLFVVKRLLTSGAAVMAVTREAVLPFSHENLLWVKGDLTDDALSLNGYLADVLIHCAPIWFLPKVIPFLAGAEVKRLVAISSTSIFSKAVSKNAYEMEMVKKQVYAEAETARLCSAHNIAYTVLRPTLIYGAGLDKNITTLARFIKRFGFFPVYPPAYGRRQPVHADDVALAALQAVCSPTSENKSYNISGGEVLSYRAMLERIFTTLKMKVKIRETTALPLLFNLAGLLLVRSHVNSEMAHRMNDDLVFFHDDATRDFGYLPRAFLTGGLRDIEGGLWHE